MLWKYGKAKSIQKLYHWFTEPSVIFYLPFFSFESIIYHWNQPEFIVSEREHLCNILHFFFSFDFSICVNRACQHIFIYSIGINIIAFHQIGRSEENKTRIRNNRRIFAYNRDTAWVQLLLRKTHKRERKMFRVLFVYKQWIRSRYRYRRAKSSHQTNKNQKRYKMIKCINKKKIYSK